MEIDTKTPTHSLATQVSQAAHNLLGTMKHCLSFNPMGILYLGATGNFDSPSGGFIAMGEPSSKVTGRANSHDSHLFAPARLSQ